MSRRELSIHLTLRSRAKRGVSKGGNARLV